MLTPANRAKASTAVCGIIENVAMLVDAMDQSVRDWSFAWAMKGVDWIGAFPASTCPPPPVQKP